MVPFVRFCRHISRSTHIRPLFFARIVFAIPRLRNLRFLARFRPIVGTLTDDDVDMMTASGCRRSKRIHMLHVRVQVTRYCDFAFMIFRDTAKFMNFAQDLVIEKMYIYYVVMRKFYHFLLPLTFMFCVGNYIWENSWIFSVSRGLYRILGLLLHLWTHLLWYPGNFTIYPLKNLESLSAPLDVWIFHFRSI